MLRCGIQCCAMSALPPPTASFVLEARVCAQTQAFDTVRDYIMGVQPSTEHPAGANVTLTTLHTELHSLRVEPCRYSPLRQQLQ